MITKLKNTNMNGKITVEKEVVTYTKVPNCALRDDSLSWKAKGLYAFLIGADPQWVLYKSDLKNRAKDGYESMISGWKELEEAGYIKTKEVRVKGMFNSYDYTVLRSPIRENTDSVKTDIGKPVANNNYIDNIDNNKQLNLPIGNTNRKKTREIFLKEKFQEFWDLYDKKVDRETAFRRFSKLKESEIEKALKVIPIYKKSQPDKKYRKNPSTWLNGKCWEDEYEPEVTQQNTLNENGENIRDSFFSEFI